MKLDVRPHAWTDLSPTELRDEIARLTGKAFHGRQVLRWIYERGVSDPADMTDLPKGLRQQLGHARPFETLQQRHVHDSNDGTRKFLFALHDGQLIETVSIPDGERLTVCFSTQVGCAMACRFCASGQSGLSRNLSPGEIVEQVLRVQRDSDRRITHLVAMGIGEPMANYDALLVAVRTLTDPEAFGLGARRVTVSTVGLAGPIRRLAEEKLSINLALSLHAPNDELRRELIPTAKQPLSEILGAVRYYQQRTGREATLEYVQLPEVNDGPEHIIQLADRLRGWRCTVNVIPFNEVEGAPYRSPSPKEVIRFHRALIAAGIKVKVRRRRGDSAAAACGQLRAVVAGRQSTVGGQQ
ncbi:MAG: 23S rRNA (adenine(2503)-C(2))-methyltransferase RlmN [Planctomycetota bacterium]